MIRKIARLNPDQKRFSVHPGRRGAFAEIRDKKSGATYSLYPRETLKDGYPGFSVLPHDASAPVTWDWHSLEELLFDLFDEIEADFYANWN